MSAAGTDIFGTKDQFRFVHKQLTGDATIMARVDSLTNTHAWAKAGVMIRNGLEVGAKHAMVAVTPGNGVSFQRRTVANDASSFDAMGGVQAPLWVKLTRTGDVFTAHYSADGTVWESLAATDDAGNPLDLNIPMAGTIYIGLALTSHNESVIGTAAFTDITTTGNVSGVWETTEIGADHPNNDPEPLYVTVEDSSGRTETVIYPGLSATQLTSWQEWPIPFSKFDAAGVNMAAVKKMSIGVGDPTNPTTGSAGLIYVDDISVGHLAVAGDYSSLVLADQPFAYYRFDDVSSNDGDPAADATGVYPGTYVGKPSLVSDAPVKIGGTSLEILVGEVESYVTAPLTPFGSLLGEGVSFEFWIKTTDTRTRKRIFGTFNNGSNTSVTIASNAGPAYEEIVGSTQIFMRRQGGGDFSAAFDQSAVNIYDGNWHHVVWTAEAMASPGADPYTVYLDGILVPLTYGATWTTAEFADFDNPFYIAQSGRETPFGGAAIEGRLDEFAVYDSVLPEESIVAHYQR
jgi:regulation of enolase protein 1 (concanavalin A-like superfamily)